MIVPAPRSRRRARIEIVPLIDVMFFLLATFMMVSLSMVQNRAIPVQLPEAESGAPAERGGSATITIAADGALFFDEEPVDAETLGRRLDALAAASPEPRVYLGGDARVDLGAAIGVLDLVRAHGIARVAIETRPPGP